MRHDAIETAAAGASAVAGGKSAATAVTTGVGTAVMSVVEGSNWATWIGVAITVLTCVMTWYFKYAEKKRKQAWLEIQRADMNARAAREQTEHEEKARLRRLQIAWIEAGNSPASMPRSESQMADLELELLERKAANV